MCQAQCQPSDCAAERENTFMPFETRDVIGEPTIFRVGSRGAGSGRMSESSSEGPDIALCSV